MTVLFIGPLPPPVHGFSTINLAMLERLRALTDVEVFDRVPKARGTSTALSKWHKTLHWLGLLARFKKALVNRPSAVYAGLSGGQGQLMDLPFFFLATRSGVPITVHHHSYAYLNSYSRVAALVFKAMKQATHICLCDDMKMRLHQQYAISNDRIVVISNAAFMSGTSGDEGIRQKDTAEEKTPLRIGFLSNITAEKGIFDFFRAADEAKRKVPTLEGLIAGPVAHEIKSDFDKELERRPWLHHVGSVYGEEKVRFYQNIDILVFPTRYQNEAEPVTILEAMRAGATVVAARRGCISGMLDQAKICACCDIADIAAESARIAVEVAALAPSVRAERRNELNKEFAECKREMNLRLDSILNSLSFSFNEAGEK